MNPFQWLNAKLFGVKYVRFLDYGAFLVTPTKYFLGKPYVQVRGCGGGLWWQPLELLKDKYEDLS
jgi:hypothetical protein